MENIFTDNDSKTKYENNEISYLFSIKIYYYKYTHEKIYFNLHIFKMKNGYK